MESNRTNKYPVSSVQQASADVFSPVREIHDEQLIIPDSHSTSKVPIAKSIETNSNGNIKSPTVICIGFFFVRPGGGQL